MRRVVLWDKSKKQKPRRANGRCKTAQHPKQQPHPVVTRILPLRKKSKLSKPWMRQICTFWKSRHLRDTDRKEMGRSARQTVRSVSNCKPYSKICKDLLSNALQWQPRQTSKLQPWPVRSPFKSWAPSQATWQVVYHEPFLKLQDA